MIKFEETFTEEEILKRLQEHYSMRPVIPRLPVITYSTNNPEMYCNFMNNIGKLSKMIFFAMQSEKGRSENWHALLDITTTGFTVLCFTSKEEISLPKLLDMPVIGSC